MKLSAAVLATLCAAGCDPVYMAPPVAPTQPVVVPYDPTVETIEGVEFAQPPDLPAVAPVRRPAPRPMVVPVQPPPRPQIHGPDDCPGCGMG